ncbi:MAG: aspartate kinase [Schleiferiaceae bacterium]|nr:aspartate kinase [Schleiferiaceae bacterium]
MSHWSLFKFGGASVKDADGFRNAVRLIQAYGQRDQIVVLSAMGKTTNTLESYLDARDQGDIRASETLLKDLAMAHEDCLKDLGILDDTLIAELKAIWQGLRAVKVEWSYGARYDATVSAGELASTKIMAAALEHAGLPCHWQDVRSWIQTDGRHRRATVNWATTQAAIHQGLQSGLYVTQGFIAGGPDGQTTTLGREGSDYSAAIIAHCLKAKTLTIWKDVQGVMSGDPQLIDDVTLLSQIPYQEAIELAFYGASVIHPKTIQPIQRNGSQLHVRSFKDPEQPHTVIGDFKKLKPEVPCWIEESDQVLIEVSTDDLSFLQEEHLAQVYRVFADSGVMVNLAQHAAVSSLFCVRSDRVAIPEAFEALDQSFNLTIEEGLVLTTVRRPDEDAHMWLAERGEVLLEQHHGDVTQVLLRPS